VGAPEYLQQMQLPYAGRRAAGKEEQSGVHSRRAAARAALLAIGQKAEVVISEIL